MNKHIKTIFKVCGITGLICVLCILCCLPFVNFKDNKSVVHADVLDTTYLFQSSNYFVTSSLYDSSVVEPQSTGFTLYNLDISFMFGFDGALNSDVFHVNANILGNFTITSQYEWYSYNTQVLYDTWVDCFIHYGSTPLHFIYSYFWETGFDAHVFKLQINTTPWNLTSTSIAHTEFIFTDVNGKKLFIQIFGNFNVTETLNYYNLLRDNVFVYDDRTYYSDISLNDNQSYIQGKDYGIQVGKEEGFKDGSAKGYDKGKQDGIEIGKELGADYSFVSFFTGLFDAPVAMVYNALDFDILGINLYTFFCGLITVFLCLALIKFIRGK